MVGGSELGAAARCALEGFEGGGGGLGLEPGEECWEWAVVQLGELGDGLLGGEVVAEECGVVDVCGQGVCGRRVVGFEIDHVIERTGRRRVCKGIAGEVREAAHGGGWCGWYCGGMRVMPGLDDDRGVTHEMPAALMRALPRRTFVRSAATGRPGMVWVMYVAGGVAVAQMWPVLLLAGDDPSRSWMAPTSIVVLALGVGLIAVPGLLYGDRLRLEAYVGNMLGSSLCPVCEYDLQGSAVEDDRCVVCAECGAAWRVKSS